ncbi:enoyl-CoA hydratase/isomerase family protein [Pseudomonas sp. UL073]|uniref:Enoyl-CoA hydratase/isomerase family protein n=1 Tax=Zestomonas insulae TaxID=2809017 RepID=A0ABS2IFP8_9GAMM|nr:enoyl-CoA hydratase/isomerase family protein [Pseudomonas insulae]MBM7061870.1 enoyl-CoA hydratase/isomerase family protein [Pseudomonas insulae]
MTASTVELSIDDGLATLVMARPERKNALNVQMFAELLDTLNLVRRNPEVKALLLTGAGSDFCSGGDVSNMGTGGTADAAGVRARMEENNRLLLAIADFTKPLISAVDGVAFGAGFSIALASDFVIASERARFCMAFARLGLCPDIGASYTLPRIVGLQKAKEIIYSAREVSAQEALQLGIALEVHPVESFLGRAEQLARSMANMSGVSFGMTKRLLARTFECDLAAQLDGEASAQAVAMTSPYMQEAAGRFLRKQPALYQGLKAPAATTNK